MTDIRLRLTGLAIGYGVRALLPPINLAIARA